GFIDRCRSDLFNTSQFDVLDFGGRYLCQRCVLAQLTLPELEYGFDERFVGAVMDLGILPIFLEGLSQRNVLWNQLVPGAFLDFGDLQSPPALRLALAAKTLFLPAPIGEANLYEIAFSLGIPHRTIRKVFTRCHRGYPWSRSPERFR